MRNPSKYKPDQVKVYLHFKENLKQNLKPENLRQRLAMDHLSQIQVIKENRIEQGSFKMSVARSP